ncbi:MAG: ATP-binding protein, partial [Muribaculaceae bacterium]|nr:ATP-binding protein [Muribaculaceae bacterium]
LTDGYGGPVQRIVLELKILRGDLEATIEKGLRQTSDYMDLAGSVDEGHFILFDRKGDKSWDERIWHEKREYNGRIITVWGM